MVSPISVATFHDGVMIETSGMEKPSTRAAWFGDCGEQRGGKGVELPGIADIEFAGKRLPPGGFEIGRGIGRVERRRGQRVTKPLRNVRQTIDSEHQRAG